LLIVLFAMGFSVMNTGFWAIVSVMVVSFARPRRFWPKWKDMIEGFVDGGVQGAKMGCICALIGLLVQTFISSGLGLKLTSGIATWSHGSLFICCLILWVTTVIAGMAGVSVAAYFTAAAFAVPVLVDLGVPFAVAHFFIVYPAAFSTITPPVALVSLVASQIAECKYTSAALETCKVAAPAVPVVCRRFAYGRGIDVAACKEETCGYGRRQNLILAPLSGVSADSFSPGGEITRGGGYGGVAQVVADVYGRQDAAPTAPRMTCL
jgi:TRAP-type uncharacterized transport system fused permease subunit